MDSDRLRWLFYRTARCVLRAVIMPIGIAWRTQVNLGAIATVGVPAIAVWLSDRPAWVIAPITLVSLIAFLFVAMPSLDALIRLRRSMLAREFELALATGRPLPGHFVLFLRPFDADASMRYVAFYHSYHGEGDPQRPEWYDEDGRPHFLGAIAVHIEDALRDAVALWGDLIVVANKRRRRAGEQVRLRDETWPEDVRRMAHKATIVVVAPLLGLELRNPEAEGASWMPPESRVWPEGSRPGGDYDGVRGELDLLKRERLWGKTMIVIPPAVDEDEQRIVIERLRAHGIELSASSKLPMPTATIWPINETGRALGDLMIGFPAGSERLWNWGAYGLTDAIAPPSRWRWLCAWSEQTWLPYRPTPDRAAGERALERIRALDREPPAADEGQ